jgi:shikimate kinase
LSLGADLEAMYRRRLPLYRQFADATVKNTGCPEETAAVIEEVSYEISRMQWAQSESVGHP